MHRIRVYVAGPYTKPDPCKNTHRAIHVGQQLWDDGFCPFVPHLTHFWHTMIPNDYSTWLEMDAIWLLQCEVMLRLPGESSGADKEEVIAAEHEIPVVRSVAELESWRTAHEVRRRNKAEVEYLQQMAVGADA